MKRVPCQKKLGGFSLVEMLIVISVIGIIAAVAIPRITSINDSAKKSRNQRNAQELASMYQSASSAGVNFMGNSLQSTVAKIVEGAEAPADSIMAGSIFRVPGLSAEVQKGAMDYLTYEDSVLKYVEGGRADGGGQTAMSTSEWAYMIEKHGEGFLDNKGTKAYVPETTVEEAVKDTDNVLWTWRGGYGLKEYNGWTSKSDTLEVHHRSDKPGVGSFDPNPRSRGSLKQTFGAHTIAEDQVVNISFAYLDRAGNNVNLRIKGDQGTEHFIKYDKHKDARDWKDISETFVLKGGENFEVEFTSTGGHPGVGSLIRQDLNVQTIAISELE